MKQIILLQHPDCKGLGTVGSALEAVGIRTRAVRGDLGEPVPQDLDGASGLEIPSLMRRPELAKSSHAIPAYSPD